jgi:hypothetical protein
MAFRDNRAVADSSFVRQIPAFFGLPDDRVGGLGNGDNDGRLGRGFQDARDNGMKRSFEGGWFTVSRTQRATGGAI